MSRYDLQTPPTKRRPQTLSALAWVGAFMCAALVGTLSPASADTFSHLPSVDLFPTLSFATGNDEYGSPGGPDPLNNYGPPIGNIQSPSAGNASGGLRSGVLDLDLAVTIPILRGLSAHTCTIAAAVSIRRSGALREA